MLLVFLILLQQGKGADAGATFGGGSNTFFGAGGADTVLTKGTTILAFMFMATSFVLALQAQSATAGSSNGGRLFRDAPAVRVEEKTSDAGKETPAQPQPEAANSSSEPAPQAAAPEGTAK